MKKVIVFLFFVFLFAGVVVAGQAGSKIHINDENITSGEVNVVIKSIPAKNLKMKSFSLSIGKVDKAGPIYEVRKIKLSELQTGQFLTSSE